MKPSLLYRFLRVYCSIGLWFYFRHWHVTGRQNVPCSGPLIYIANHQNAFLDAILMTCSATRSPFYLARAGVFSKPWAARLLSLVHIKPIYRFRDGFSTLKNNDVVMQDCVNLMKEDEVILLFPEGNHSEPWSIREFQKGFARLAMLYHNQTNGAALHIVPIGIHYLNHNSFNARVLINFGKPLLISDYVKIGATERENLESLVAAGQNAVQHLALDLKPESEYEQRQAHLVENRAYQSEMLAQLESDKKTASQYPIKRVKPAASNSALKALHITVSTLVFATHGVLYWAIAKLIKSKIKDSQFIGSVKYATGIFATPVYYLILFIIVYSLSASVVVSVILVAALPCLLVFYTKVLPPMVR